MQMQAKMKTVEEQHADYQRHIAVLKESLIAKEEHYNMLQIDVREWRNLKYNWFFYNPVCLNPRSFFLKLVTMAFKLLWMEINTNFCFKFRLMSWGENWRRKINSLRKRQMPLYMQLKIKIESEMSLVTLGIRLISKTEKSTFFSER